MVRKRFFGNVFKDDGNVIISRDMDSGEDICPHDWVPIRTVEEYQVFRCRLKGCIKVHSPYRSSITEFINFLRALPKIDKLPEHSLLDITEFARSVGLDQRQVKKYYRALQELDIDGRPTHTMVGSRRLFYLDDDKNEEGLKKMRRELNERYERLRREDERRMEEEIRRQSIDNNLVKASENKGFSREKPIRTWLKRRPTIVLEKPLVAMFDDDADR